MTDTRGIDYSNWANSKAIEIAKKVDNDGIKGLQGTEIFNFACDAASEIEKEEIYSLLGVSITKTRASSKAESYPRPYNPEFDKAVKFYNTKLPARTYLMLDSEVQKLERHKITENAKQNCTERLHNMEQEITQAKMECTAFDDELINVVSDYWYPGYHHRIYYKGFDIEKIRTNTQADMESIYEFKDKVESIVEKAKGISETEHQEPEKTEYDIEALAVKHLGMSYKDFEKLYPDEIEFCKTVTPASFATMTERQTYVYNVLKSYAEEMLNITINEVYSARFDSGERILDETFDATGDMFDIEYFEYDGITKNGLDEIQSGIMYKAFEEALISKHRELDPSGIYSPKTEDKQNRTIKCFVDKAIQIIKPGKPVYDISGRKVK